MNGFAEITSSEVSKQVLVLVSFPFPISRISPQSVFVPTPQQENKLGLKKQSGEIFSCSWTTGFQDVRLNCFPRLWFPPAAEEAEGEEMFYWKLLAWSTWNTPFPATEHPRCQITESSTTSFISITEDSPKYNILSGTINCIAGSNSNLLHKIPEESLLYV